MNAERAGDQAAAGGGDDDRLLAALPALLKDLAAGAVVELEVSVGEARLYLRQRPGPPPPPAPPTVSVDGIGGPAAEEEGLVAVVTPLSGVFYAAPAPDEPPYVREGEEVEAGQVVALIEAMKVFNDIHVDVAGVVTRLLVAGGQLVQAGQPLMLIRPHAPGDAATGAGALAP